MMSAKYQLLSLQWMEPQLCSDSGCVGVTKVTAYNSSLALAPSKMGLIISIYVHISKLHFVIRCGRMQKQNTTHLFTIVP